MKIICIFFCCINLLFISCNNTHNQIINRTTGRDLTVSEKNFIPYEQNDTFSFFDGKGRLLSYICNQRIDARYDIKLTSCGPKDDYCDIDNEETLEVNLTCSNIDYNLKMGIYENGQTFKLNFYNQPVLDIVYKGTGNKFKGDLFADSACGIPTDCIDSIIINTKKYYKVVKLVDYTDLNSIDTVYYTRANGIIKFCMTDSTVWTKR
jgi:hypothetical protein